MISGKQWRDAVISGANNIIKVKKSVDELNIFPVPDGDTGTNMSMTISAASSALAVLEDTATAAEAAKVTASAMLRGARGNSGVILSLLFRGIAKGFEGKTEVDGNDLVTALDLGVQSAYKAVMNPTEGTILTVARVATERAAAAAERDTDPIYVWAAACLGAQEALEETPNLLPVLKKAGVVDAGGKGLCLIFEGMLSLLRDGEMVETVLTPEEKQAETEAFFRNAAAEFDQEINFTYCTEFIVGRDPECTKDPDDLRSYLMTIGDCVVVVDDEEIIKTHVHTEAPGNALQKALEYGQLLTVKIENMKEQHRKASEANAQAKAAAPAEKAEQAAPERAEPTDDFGFVSVAAGAGVQDLFRDLGCAGIVSGGQTMNPSTEDILAAVLAVPAKTVYVLPNNKNIIMAAEQVVPLVEDRTVVIIPTRTVPQGLSAMLAFDPDGSVEMNRSLMMDAASVVETGLVTFAARDSEFGGKKIRQGEILGLENGKLRYVEDDMIQTVVKLTRAMAKKETAFITLIYGQDVTEEQAQEAYDRIRSKISSNVEITLVNGGQPVYYFIVSLE